MFPNGALAALLPPHRRSLLAVGSFAGTAPLLDLLAPWPLTIAIDHAIDAHPGGGPPGAIAGLPPLEVLALAGLAALALAALSAAVDYRTAASSERVAERIGAELRQQLFDQLVTLSPRFHDRMRSGELVSRLTVDIGRVMDAVVAGTVVLLPDTLLVAGVLSVLFLLDPLLAVVALAVVPLLAAVATRQRRRVRAAQAEARARDGALAGIATDLLRNVRAVQAFDAHASAGRQFGRASLAARDAEIGAARVHAGWAPRADLVLALGTAAALVVGGQRVLDGTITTGQLLVVLAYVDDLYGPIRALARLSGTFAKAGASLARLSEILDSRERVPDDPAGRPAPALSRGVRLHRVTFGHTPHRPVLHEVDVWIPAGQVVAVIGPNGSGKTTLLHLLLRLDDVDAGKITIDDVDLRRVRLAALRRRIAFVPQDPWLFDATVAENIALAATPATTRAEVAAAARGAGLDEVLRRLPNGLDTPLGEGGALLSGGERRRVALARAMLSGAPLLLLDEPTVALDAAARAEVLRSLAAATNGRTTVVVTHDDAVIRLADRVVELHPVGPTPTPGEEMNHAIDREPAGAGSAVAPRRRPAPPPEPQPEPESQPQPRLSG